MVCLSWLSTGCLNQGNLTLIPPAPDETYVLSGSISLPEPVETDLMLSWRSPLADAAVLADFSKFKISTETRYSYAEKTGAFSLSKVPYSETMILTASSGKVALQRRIYPDDLKTTSLTNLTIDLDTTARALIWTKAFELKKVLTEADIAAREHQNLVASVTQALKLALLMPSGDVPKTILDLAMVLNPAVTAANAIQPRETGLVEAHEVIYQNILREDRTILSYYISTGFSNDFDSTSNYSDFMSAITGYFADNVMKTASYTILQMEFLTGDQARVRIAMEASYTNYFSGLDGQTLRYTSDVFWKREGTFWKILRNVPYRSTHPTQVDVDGRWGELSRAHSELQEALFRENMDTLKGLVSLTFANDWDAYSTYGDMLNTAKARFDAMDVRVASYSVHSIEFQGNEYARVSCSGQVKVVSLQSGQEIDSGVVKAVVDWRRENGTWKLFRNLPYRFSHPRNLMKAIRQLFPLPGF
jgi:hypothetical protein